MGFLNSLNPKSYIGTHNRSLEKSRSVSSWFRKESITVDFGEYVGRPSKNILLQKEYLVRFLENGWTIDSVMSKKEDGLWKRITQNDSVQSEVDKEGISETQKSNGSSTDNSSSNTNSHSTQDTNTASNSNSVVTHMSSDNSNQKSNSSGSTTRGDSVNSSSSSESTSKSGTSTYTTSTNSSSQQSTNQVNDSTSNSSSSGTKSSSSDNSTNRTTNGAKDIVGTTINTEDGAVYWEAVQKVRLSRRRMMPELVLQDMISDFTVSYNEGIKNDDARYNELVSLYSAVVKQNETDGAMIVSQALDVQPLLDEITNSVMRSLTSANNAAVEASLAATTAAVDDINRRFEALKSQTITTMVSNGTYNGTVWPTVLSGIERDWSAAIAKAKADAAQVAVSAHTSVAQVKGSVGASLIAAKQNISDALDRRRISVVELRNNVVKWMLDFVGSREDTYPQLQEISAMCERIGFSVGATGNVL